MIFARKDFAATLLDLKMSLGLDIAVGGLVSFKLRVRVSILLFLMSAKMSIGGNTRYLLGFETRLAKEMGNQAPIPLQAPAREKRKKKQ
jgi:hypothetical protein